MNDDIQPDEPVIVFTVRSLFRDMRDEMTKQFEEFGRKLEDRPTLGMFRAAQSEAEATRARVSDLEDWQTEVLAVIDAKRVVSGRVLAWAGLTVAVVSSIVSFVAAHWIGG